MSRLSTIVAFTCGLSGCLRNQTVEWICARAVYHNLKCYALTNSHFFGNHHSLESIPILSITGLEIVDVSVQFRSVQFELIHDDLNLLFSIYRTVGWEKSGQSIKVDHH